jgi:flagellar hook-basal body complex protein FliE
MTITPIENTQSIVEQIKPAIGKPQTRSASFSDVFEKAIENVAETEAVAKHNQVLLATGQADDLHTIMIDASKAELALSMFVQIRNKALDAYNELMKMTL